MTIFPPFVMRYSTSINAIRRSDRDMHDILGVIGKYMASIDAEQIVAEGHSVHFRYLMSGRALNLNSNGAIRIEKGVFDVSFCHHKVVVRYTFSMFRMVYIWLGAWVVLGFLKNLPEGRYAWDFLDIGLIGTGVFWMLTLIREWVVLIFVRRKIMVYLGTRTI